jgi:predicted  nucleic acid-binding Zn-ribbon protein
MFRAVFRLLSGCVYFMTAGIVNLEKSWFRENVGVLEQKYEKLIDEKRKDGQKSVEALTGLVKTQEMKRQEIAKFETKVADLERKFEVHMKAAKKRATDLAHLSPDELNKDADYLKYKTAAMDYQSTLKSNKESLEAARTELKTFEAQVLNMKTVVQSLQRDVTRLADKKYEAIGKVIGAKQAREAQNQANSFNRSNTAQLERELDDIVNEATASVKVSMEMMNVDANKDEANLLADAERTAASDEFDRLIGVAEKVETAQPESVEKAKLPE